MRAQIDGGKTIAQRLRILPREVAHNHLKDSAQVGAEVIRQAIENRAPRGQGNRTYKGKPIGHMADNIEAKVTKERGGLIEISIGPSKRHFYSRMVEFGHRLVKVVSRYQKKAGGRKYRVVKELGSVPPRPFMRPGWDESHRPAERAVGETLRRRLKMK